MTERASISDRWASLSNLQRCIVIVLIAAFFMSWFAQRQIDTEQQKTILRDQFHLSSSITFASFNTVRRRGHNGPLQGTVRFSKNEYQNYIASFADANIWKPMPLRDRRIGTWKPMTLPDRRVGTIGQYSDDALRWSETKPPLRFDDVGMVQFGIYGDSKLNQLDNALHFCYAVVRSNSTATTVPTYAAVSCWELDPREVPSVIVQGVLDPETRTLYMRI